MLYGFDQDAALEFGIYTLADHIPHPHTANRISAQERIQQIIQLAQAAEDAGVDFFGVGESHQAYFVAQAHTVILAAIAQATSRMKIGSSSSIVSTADPVRLYEDFATIDLISDGRAEIVAGRASRLGLYKLLGYDVEDYEALYEEKFDLLNLINNNEIVDWEGDYRPPLDQAVVLPRPKQKRLPIWRAVGGHQSSAEKAGRAGVPLFLAHLGGPTDSYVALFDAYRQAAHEAGHVVEDLPTATGGLFYLGQDNANAMKEAYPYINQGMMLSNGTGFPKSAFAKADSKDSVINVGEPNWVIDKILDQHERFNNQRYTAQFDFGGVPFDKQLEIIDIIGEKIIPALKKYTGSKDKASQQAPKEE